MNDDGFIESMSKILDRLLQRVYKKKIGFTFIFFDPDQDEDGGKGCAIGSNQERRALILMLKDLAEQLENAKDEEIITKYENVVRGPDGEQ